MYSLEVTRAACDEAVHILNDILTFDKIEDGLFKLELQPVSARDIVEASVSIFLAQVRCEPKNKYNHWWEEELEGLLYRSLFSEVSSFHLTSCPPFLPLMPHLRVAQASQSGIDLTCKIFQEYFLAPPIDSDHSSPLPPQSMPFTNDKRKALRDVILIADKNKLSHVIHNLVSNALKFTQSGGTVDVQMSLEESSSCGTKDVEGNDGRPDGYEDHELLIQVADSGAGISKVQSSTAPSLINEQIVSPHLRPAVPSPSRTTRRACEVRICNLPSRIIVS